MKNTVLKKTMAAFQDLGIALTKRHSVYEFEYGHVPMFLSVDERNQCFGLLAPVLDSSDGKMDRSTLETAINVVAEFHEGYTGDWNNGVPIFISPAHEVEGMETVSAEWLEERLKAFVDAYFFLEANVHLVSTTDLFG